MEDAPDFNPYVYCEDNPVNMTDPDGRWPWPTWNQVKSFASGVGNGAVNYAKGVGNAVANAPARLAKGYSSPKEALKLMRDTHPLTQVVKQFSTPAKIVERVVEGNAQAAGEAYGGHLAEGALSWATAGAFKGRKTETSASKSEISPNVQAVLNTLDDIKANGGQVSPNKLKAGQELNMTVTQGESSLNLRVETHPLPKKFGGDGTTPQRHLNVEPVTTKNNPLPNGGHKILE